MMQLTAIAYGLLVFFAAGIGKNVWQFYRSEKAGTCAQKHLSGLHLLREQLHTDELYAGTVFHCAGNRDNRNEWLSRPGSVTELPTEIVDKIESVGMLESIPLWIVTLLGSLLITVLSFVMILTVYGRMFKIYMYTAIALIPISSFAGEPTQSIGKNFIRSYVGVCLKGNYCTGMYYLSAYGASPPGCRRYGVECS